MTLTGAYHEPYPDLPSITRDEHRALISMKEELEAVDWYNQRAAVTTDEELKAILENGKVSRMEGSATLKVKVEVLFFSKTVSVTVRRQLNAADADPSFQEVYQLEEWQAYCLAFA